MPNLIPKSAQLAILQRYRPADPNTPIPNYELSYATVRDFCDSADHLPQLLYFNSDLKDVQRPWTLKAILARIPPRRPDGSPSLLIEIGGGVPLTAAALADLGYRVIVVDPYQGAGNGPTEFGHYRRTYPQVQFVRDLFYPNTPGLTVQSADAVFSISTLEHIPVGPEQESIFTGMRRFLKPGGWSIHCVDSVVDGFMEPFHTTLSEEILARQRDFAGLIPAQDEYQDLLRRLQADLDTYYLGPQGFHQWRFGQAYDAYPFQKIVSLQTCVAQPVAAA